MGEWRLARREAKPPTKSEARSARNCAWGAPLPHLEATSRPKPGPPTRCYSAERTAASTKNIKQKCSGQGVRATKITVEVAHAPSRGQKKACDEGAVPQHGQRKGPTLRSFLGARLRSLFAQAPEPNTRSLAEATQLDFSCVCCCVRGGADASSKGGKGKAREERTQNSRGHG